LSSDRCSNVNSAYNFDGLDDYILFNLNSISNSFPAASATTTSVWVQTNDLNGPIISISGVGGYEYLLNVGTLADIVQSAGNYGMLVRDNCCGAGNNIFGGNVVNNDWHMITVVRSSNGTLYLYKDGILDVTSSSGQSGALNFSTTTMAFGANLSWVIGSQNGCASCNTVDQQHLNGKIDDIGIWNRALTPQEILALYTAQLTTVSVYAGLDQTICNGDPVTLTAINSLNYSWDNGVTDGVAFNPTSTQDYTVSADSAGCLSTDVVTVTVNENTTATQTQTALDSYTWPINSQTYTQSGTYTAVIPNAAGCDSTITLDLSLDFTGINEFSEDNLFTVFPNPAQSLINIRVDSKLIGSVYTISDNAGRAVLTGKLNSKVTTIELNNLSGGIYMCSVGENMKQTFKVIKE
jgi:hypothetical protein